MDSPQNDFGAQPNYAPYSGRAQQKPKIMPSPVGGGNTPNPAFMPQQMPGQAPSPNPVAGSGSAYQPPTTGLDPNNPNPLMAYLSKMAAQKAF